MLVKWARSHKLRCASILLILSLVIVIMTNNVSGKLTNSDKESIKLLIADLKIDKDLIHRDYDYQINVLTQINSKVLSHIKNSSDGIPLGSVAGCSKDNLDRAIQCGARE